MHDGGRAVGGHDSPGSLCVDVRGFTPLRVRELILGLVDLCVRLETNDAIVVVGDHEPTGLELQLDLRRETRGLFEYESHQRADGAWVELIRWRI